MKARCTITIALLSAAWASVPPGLWANGGLLIERVGVDAVVGSGLLAKGLDGEGLRELLAEGGEVLESCYLVGSAGKLASLASAHELIYPTEWDPGEVPTKLAGPIEAGMRVQTHPAPGGFETRRIGFEMQWEPDLIGAEAPVAGELTLTATALRGLDAWGAAEHGITVPRIATQELRKAQLQLPPERWALLAVHQPFHQPGRLVFVFGKVLMQVAPLPHADAPPDPFGADGDDLPAPGRIAISAELIGVSAALFAELMDGAPQLSDWRRQRVALGAMIDSGAATMLGSTAMVVESGGRVKGGSELEYVYPVSGDPPEIPQNLAAPPADTAPIITAKATTSTAVRPLGLVVEVEPTVDRGAIRLGVTVEHVTHDRDLEFGRDEGIMTMPVFDLTKLITEVRLASGADMLLAAVTPRVARTGEPAGDRRVLIFVRTEVLRDEPR